MSAAITRSARAIRFGVVLGLALLGCSVGGCMRFGYELLDAEPAGQAGAGGSIGGPFVPSDSPLDASGLGIDSGQIPDDLDASAGLAADAQTGDATDARAPADVAAPPAVCRSYGDFSTPERVTFASAGETWGPAPSADNASLLVGLTTGLDEDVAIATRPDRGASFGALSELAVVNSSSRDGTPFLSADGRSLYFFSERPGGLGERDLMLATRPDESSNFLAPSFLTALNSNGLDHQARLSEDELSLVFESTRAGGAGGPDIWLADRNLRSDAFGAPRNLTEINTADVESGPALSADGLTLLLVSVRPGGTGATDIWLAERADRASPFAGLREVAELNSTGFEYDVALTVDGTEVFFVSTRLGPPYLWRATRVCFDPPSAP